MGHRAHARVQKVNKESADNPMDKACLPWQEASIPKYQHSETKILMINTVGQDQPYRPRPYPKARSFNSTPKYQDNETR